MKFILLIFLCMFSYWVSADEADKAPNIKYEYKKYEKFDLNEINVEGEAGAPGDLSITPALRDEFKNKIEERKNFNNQLRNAIETIN
jgi:hypothetical protein